MWIQCIAALVLLCSARAEFVSYPKLGIKIAKGFNITLFANPNIASDVYSMTIDPEGSVVISSRGYIKRLIDEDGDGIAEKDLLLRQSSSGAMGMLYVDKRTLLASEGGKFNRYIDEDGDGIFENGPELIGRFGGGEHGIHGIRKDKKGRIYLIGGNDAKFSGHEDLKQYRGIEGGGIIRYTPELEEPILICHGFRNPYDFDFNSEGQIYTYDSDCEREFLLPWYSPTRLYRVEDRAHHGWRLPGYKRGWKRPDYYFDSVKPLVNVGRGSPTGVMVYKHTAFPEYYHDAVFYCDWTFGKVFMTSTSTNSIGAEFPSSEVFLESMGTNGFAPTDIELAPDGSVYLSVGGRGTTGSVYKISAINIPEKPKAITIKNSIYEGYRNLNSQNNSEFSYDRSMALARHLDRTLINSKLEERLKVLRSLMKSLGDWNLAKPSLESLTGYELSFSEIFDEENHDLIQLSRNSSRALLHSLHHEERLEAARMVAMLKDPNPISLRLMLSFFSPDSSPEDDFHYLTCISCLPIKLDEGNNELLASAILSLDKKLGGKQVRGKQNYIDRLNEVIKELAKRGSLYDALIKNDLLVKPNHIGIVNSFPESYRDLVALKFFESLKDANNDQWNNDIITLLSSVDYKRTHPIFRELAKDPLLSKTCIIELAKMPIDQDRSLFVSGLGSADKNFQKICIRALSEIGPSRELNELLALFRMSDSKLSLPLISKLLGREANKEEAIDWLKDNYPKIADSIISEQKNINIDWNQLFSKVDWSQGDEKRGRIIFSQRACESCHLSTNALGPDLSGVAKRLSPNDLFHSIANPNDNVPPAYRATAFTMKDGTKKVGRIAFYSADGVIVRTGPEKTIRLDEKDIANQKDWTTSIMPEGLLIGLTETQLADLYWYIKTL